DGGGVEQHFGAGQRHQARGFRVPLVPAHQHAQLADGGLDGLEAEVARREVELLVVTGVVRDVHLAVLAGQAAVGLQHYRGVVIQPRRATLEQRGDDDHAEFLRQRSQRRGGRGRSRYGESERRRVLGLAEVGAELQSLQQHELGALRGGLAHALHADLEVVFAVVVAVLLHQADTEDSVLAHWLSPTAAAGICMVMQCRLPKPRITGRQSIMMMSWPGKAAASTSRAFSSAASSYAGARTAPLMMRKLAWVAGGRCAVTGSCLACGQGRACSVYGLPSAWRNASSSARIAASSSKCESSRSSQAW